MKIHIVLLKYDGLLYAISWLHPSGSDSSDARVSVNIQLLLVTGIPPLYETFISQPGGKVGTEDESVMVRVEEEQISLLNR